MITIVCPDCKVQLRTEKIGVTILETFGRFQLPYKLLSADLLECPICHKQIVFTDAQPRHITGEPVIHEDVILALMNGTLFLSHEFPAGDNMEERLVDLKKEKGE